MCVTTQKVLYISPKLSLLCRVKLTSKPVNILKVLELQIFQKLGMFSPSRSSFSSAIHLSLSKARDIFAADSFNHTIYIGAYCFYILFRITTICLVLHFLLILTYSFNDSSGVLNFNIGYYPYHMT